MSNNINAANLLASFTAAAAGRTEWYAPKLDLETVTQLLPLAAAAARANVAPMWSRSPEQLVHEGLCYKASLCIAAAIDDNWVFPNGATVAEVKVAVADIERTAMTRAAEPVAVIAKDVKATIRWERDYAYSNWNDFNFEKTLRAAMASHMLAWFR